MLCSSLHVATSFNKWRSKEYAESLKVLRVSLHSRGVASWSLSRGAGEGKLFHHLYVRVALPALLRLTGGTEMNIAKQICWPCV